MGLGLYEELQRADLLCRSTRWDAEVYDFDGATSPHLMAEVRRLRDLSFLRVGVVLNDSCGVDTSDVDGGCRQVIVWDCRRRAIAGGYRYSLGRSVEPSRLTISRYFRLSQRFIQEYLPCGMELGRTFISQEYQKGANALTLYTLDTLWEGLSAVVKANNIDYLFGRVTLYPALGVRARNLLMGFMRFAYPSDDSLMQAHAPERVEMAREDFDEIFVGATPKDNYRILLSRMRELDASPPPIISSYMRLSPSMQVFDSYANWDLGGVVETAIMLKVNDFYDEIKRRYLS